MSRQPLPWGLTAHHVPVWIQAPVALLVLDFVMYVRHRCEHRFDFLWRFHQIHHAPTEFSTLAVCGRFNFLENVVLSHMLSGVVAYAMGIGSEVYVFAYSIPFTFFGCHYSHLNVRYPWGQWRMANIVNNPSAHALHHSLENDRRNYGFILLLWDMLFGTFELPGRTAPTVFGTRGELAEMGILKQHVYAFRGLWPGEGRSNRRDELQPVVDRSP